MREIYLPEDAYFNPFEQSDLKRCESCNIFPKLCNTIYLHLFHIY